MATNPASWGVLGNPSKEKIQEYAKMPVGSFKSMVKNLSRGRKNKVLTTYEVFVTRRDINATRGVIKVEAFTSLEAYDVARQRQDEVVWDAEPFKTNYQEYVHSTFDPVKYKD